MQHIVCPHCGKEVELTEALLHDFKDEISKELKTSHEEQLEKFKKETLEVEKKRFEEENASKIKGFQEEVEKLKLRTEKERGENEKRLDLELKKRQEELEEKSRMDKLQLEKKLDDTKKALEVAQRKSEQSSQQLIGEVLELDLEANLKKSFPNDEILPVPKGINGGDVLQKIRNNKLQPAGAILWETKRAKDWSNRWSPKLKEDMRAAEASVAILVSEVLPEKIKNFGWDDGVWVTNYKNALSLALVLRASVMQVNVARSTAANKDPKLENLYKYLTNPRFVHRIEEIGETIVSLQADLDNEKKIALRNWKKRELQISKLSGNTSNLYFELQGIVGDALPPLKLLEGSSAENEDFTEDNDELKLLN